MEDRLTDQTQLEAERLRLHEAERRQRILSEISAILLDYVGGDEDEPLRRIVDKVVQGMGDWCAFSLIGPDGLLRQAAAYHPDPRQRDLAEKLNRIQHPRRWDAGPAQTNALVQKRPLVFEEITDEMLRAGVQGEDEYRLLKDIGLASAIVAPLVTGAEPLGTLILASAGAGGRKYTPNDVDFVVALADRASLAARNARLVRELAEERDREQFAREGAERRAAELLATFVAAPELRTTPTPLSMCVQSIGKRLARRMRSEPELANKARRQVTRLGRLVEDLLDISPIESGRLEIHRDPVELEQLIGEVVDDFRSAAHSHEIVVVRPPEQTVVLGDHQRLEQVMVNLLQNAIKYSPQGGQIVVTVGREGGDAVASGADQGIGVPAEEQAKLFQRFFRARNAATRHFGGLGIGLFVSHEIVQRHGGRFLVARERGQGAVLSFALPLSPTHAAPDRGRAPAQA